MAGGVTVSYTGRAPATLRTFSGCKLVLHKRASASASQSRAGGRVRKAPPSTVTCGISSSLTARQESITLQRLDPGMDGEKLHVTFGGLHPGPTLDQLKMLNSALFPIKYKEGFYRDCCASGDVTQLAYHEGQLVGAIACRLELQPDYSAKLYVMTVGVLAPFRGCGLGRQLMERSLAEAQKDAAIRSAYLHVQQTNHEAITFYKKFGFEEAEVIKDYYSKLPDGRDALILSRTLV